MFLFAGSGAMVLLADAPHGLHEVQRLMLSSLLGASQADVLVASGLLAATAAAVLAFRRRLLLWAMDPPSAQVYGTSLVRQDLLVGAWAGGVIGFAIHATGLTFTFGCTVLPVLFVRELAGSLTVALWLAPAVGGCGYVASFVLADRLDLPPGQCCVAVLGGAVAIARLLVWPGRR
jgi:ABC-type Mn2+/Zn2+ transport system permease subunit